MKIYCFDIDGTICTISVADYSMAEPYPERINQISFPLIHPIVKLDRVFDKAYISKTKLPPIRTFKNFAKSLIEFFNFQKKSGK